MSLYRKIKRSLLPVVALLFLTGNATAEPSHETPAGVDAELGTLVTTAWLADHLDDPDLVVLDEPTNDLDVNTLRALEEGLESFAGCAVIISHDRWFLDRICTHILAFEGDSQVYYFEGSFSEYEENRKKRLGGEATPKRFKYKKLIRE